MTRLSLREMGPHSPLSDRMVQLVGLYPAVVWGRVWSYCQMRDGVCKATQSTIAERCGMSRKSVNTALRKLVREGYLTETQPDGARAPHHYKLTRKMTELVQVPRALFERREVYH